MLDDNNNLGFFGKDQHCMKSVEILSYFLSVFSCIQSEYKKIRTRNNFVFGHVSRSAMECNCYAHSKNSYKRNSKIHLEKDTEKVLEYKTFDHLWIILVWLILMISIETYFGYSNFYRVSVVAYKFIFQKKS